MAVDAFEGPYLAVGGQRFAWAEGRLLPDHLAQDWSLYSPQPFYEYPAQEPDVSQWTDEMVFAAEARLAGRRSSLLHRSSAFFDALWGVKDRGSADDQQTRISFIGLPVTVHRSLVEPLKRVEGRLRKAREGDAELDAFLRTLVRLEGFNWRPIAET